MKASSVTQVCHWLKITEVDLFRCAYKWKYDEPGHVENYIVDFHLFDKIPYWVVQFVRTQLYPHLIRNGGLHGNPMLPYRGSDCN